MPLGRCHDLAHRTGGKGKVYQYHTCSACARKGKAACPGRSIHMDRLDSLVVMP